jgi:hypothetical protein
MGSVGSLAKVHAVVLRRTELSHSSYLACSRSIIFVFKWVILRVLMVDNLAFHFLESIKISFDNGEW